MGRDTSQAKIVLAALEETLRAYRARRDLIRDAMDARGGSQVGGGGDASQNSAPRDDSEGDLQPP
jgi:hypothetical protein